MKNLFYVALLSIAFFSCEEKKVKPIETKEYALFGDSISQEHALSQTEMMEKYATLKEGDTIAVKFKSTINEVCQKKGCWMTLPLDEKKETFVKFKDYAFFVPLNAQKKEVIVEGKAFISVESVASLQHYAKDAGKSEAEIEAITQPEITYSFLAEGVLISKK